MGYRRLTAALVLGALSAPGDLFCHKCVDGGDKWQLKLNLTSHQYLNSCESDCTENLTKPAETVVCLESKDQCSGLRWDGMAFNMNAGYRDIQDGEAWGGCSGADHWGTNCARCLRMMSANGYTFCRWDRDAGCVDSVVSDASTSCPVGGSCLNCPDYALDVTFALIDGWTSSCRPCKPRFTTDGLTKCVSGKDRSTACGSVSSAMARLFGDRWYAVHDDATSFADTLCYEKALREDCDKCTAAKDSSMKTNCVSLAALVPAGNANKPHTPVLCVEDSEKELNHGMFTQITTCPSHCDMECGLNRKLEEVLDLTAQTVVTYKCVNQCENSAADPRAYTRCLSDGPDTCVITPTTEPQDPDDPAPQKPRPIDLTAAANKCLGFGGNFKCEACVGTSDCAAYKLDETFICLPKDWPRLDATQIDTVKECPSPPACDSCSSYGGSFVVKTRPGFDTINGACAQDCALDATAEAGATGFCIATPDKCAHVSTAINSKILAGGRQQLPDDSCFAHARQTSCAKCTDDGKNGKCKWDTQKFMCIPTEEDVSEILGVDSISLVTQCPYRAQDGSECAKCDSNAYMVSVRANSKSAIAGCVPGCPTDDEKNAFAPELGAVDCVDFSQCAAIDAKTFPNTYSYIADATTITKTGDLALKDASCWGYTCQECFAATPPASGSKAEALCVYLNTPPPPTTGSKESTPDQRGTLYMTQGCVPSEWWSKNKDTARLQGKFKVVAEAESCPAEPTKPPGSNPNAAHGLTVLSTLAVTALAALLL